MIFYTPCGSLFGISSIHMNNEPTNQDILDVLQAFAGSVDHRFESIEQRFEKIDQRFEKIDLRFNKIDQRFDKIESNVSTIKATMVTKEYLDDKMFDLRGDLVSLVRKEDRKLAAVVDELVKRDVFDDATAHRIFELEPFAK